MCQDTENMLWTQAVLVTGQLHLWSYETVAHQFQISLPARASAAAATAVTHVIYDGVVASSCACGLARYRGTGLSCYVVALPLNDA